MRKIPVTGRVGQKERTVDRDKAVGVDVVNPLLRRVRLKAAQGPAGGQDLAVEVGEAHNIMVHQVQRPDARARQRLEGIAADPAEAEHGHAAAAQLFHRRRAIDALRP